MSISRSPTSTTDNIEKKDGTRTIEYTATTKAAKVYQEMEAYVKLFTEIMSGIHNNCNPFTLWYSEANATGTFSKILHDRNIVNAISKYKTPSTKMINMVGHNPFYTNIQGFLTTEKFINEDTIHTEVVKNLTKFILETLGYTFLQIDIEFKRNEQEKIKHYKLLQELCLSIISSKKWSINPQAWIKLFQNKFGNKFTGFIHLLLSQLTEKINDLTIEVQPDNLKNLVTDLYDKVDLTLRTSRSALIKLVSNEEIPPNLFSHPDVIAVFNQGKGDCNYFFESPTIPSDIKIFVGNQARYHFIMEQFFAPKQKQLLDAAYKIAEDIAAQKTHPSLDQSDASRALLAGPSAFQATSSFMSKRVVIKSALATTTRTTLSLTAESEPPVPVRATSYNKQIENLKNENNSYLEKKLESLYKHIGPSFPIDIQKALIPPTSTRSVDQIKHATAVSLLLNVVDIAIIIHRLQIIHVYLENIKEIIKRGANFSKLLIFTELRNLCEKLSEIIIEIHSYSDIVKTSLDLRNEIESLNDSTWSYNVNLSLTDIHTAIKLFREMPKIIEQIYSCISLKEIYNDFKETLIYKQKLEVTQTVFLGIAQSKSVFEDHLAQWTRIIFNAAETQQLCAHLATQDNAFYLQPALTSLLMPGDYSSQASIHSEEVTDGDEFNLDEFREQKIGKRAEWKVKHFLEGSIEEVRGEPHLIAENNRLKLSSTAKEYFLELHNSRMINRLRPQTGNSLSAFKSPSALELNKDYIKSVENNIKNLKGQEADMLKEVEQIIPAAKAKVDRNKDFSYKILKPNNLIWLCTIIAIPFYLPLIFLAGIYRLLNYKSILKDRNQYEALVIHESECRAKVENIRTKIVAFESKLKEHKRNFSTSSNIISETESSSEQKSEQRIEIVLSTNPNPELNRSALLALPSPTQTAATLFHHANRQQTATSEANAISRQSPSEREENNPKALSFACNVLLKMHEKKTQPTLRAKIKRLNGASTYKNKAKFKQEALQFVRDEISKTEEGNNIKNSDYMNEVTGLVLSLAQEQYRQGASLTLSSHG